MIESKKFDLEIYAGACSVGPENIDQIYQIAQSGKVFGARVVGLKSRTSLNPSGEGMGIDFDALEHTQQHGVESGIVPPSVVYARDIVRETGLHVATEVMMPEVQLPHYEREEALRGKLLVWNPSVDQLGWHVRQTARYAARNGWALGLKNGKALGVTLENAEDPKSDSSPLEDGWAGLATYAEGADEIVLIHRGVDIPEKGNQRNALVHEVAGKVKKRVTGSKLFFDPSHSYGPKMRDEIVDRTVDTMRMQDNDGYLYDGILIETGTSRTDTGQHITVAELEAMTDRLATFRQLRTPEKVVFSGKIYHK